MRRARQLRPWYLVAAMVLTGVLGFYGAWTGSLTVMFLRSGSVVDAQTAARTPTQGEELVQIMASARLTAMSDHRGVTFPLSVGRTLLGGLLVVASALALAGRPGARSLAMQALLANVAFALLDYMLTRNVRAAWIEAMARACQELPTLPADVARQFDRQFLWWVERSFAAVNVGVLGMAATALTMPRAKRYFEAVAAALESPDDP